MRIENAQLTGLRPLAGRCLGAIGSVSSTAPEHQREVSLKAENGSKCFVDAPQLLAGEMPDHRSETCCVHGADLLDEDASGLTLDLSLGAE